MSESTTALDGVPAAVVRIAKDQIWVNNVSVVNLVDRVVPETERRGLLIAYLYERLLREAYQTRELYLRLEQAEHSHESLDEMLTLRIEAEHTTAFATLRSVMYTGGQAGFADFDFVVRSSTPGAPFALVATTLPAIPAPHEPMDTGPDLRIFIDSDGYGVLSDDPDRYNSIVRTTHADWMQELQRVDCTPTPCTGPDAYDNAGLRRVAESLRTDAHGPFILVVPGSDTAYQTVIDAIDTVRGNGERADELTFVIAGGGE